MKGNIAEWVKIAGEVIRLSELATSGPWGAQVVGYGTRVLGGPKHVILMDMKGRKHEENARLVAFSRNWAAELANAVMALVERVRELEAADRWIPVYEQMPDDCMDVLVARGICGDVYAAVHEDGGWYEVGSDMKIEDVTHWKEMPAGPVKEVRGA